jgi:outer membrane protein TolC
MKNITVVVFMMSAAFLADAQDILTLQECYARAEANYPLTRQRALIAKSRNYSVANAVRASLPQVSLGGQATYQSDVTQIPVEMPGVEPLSKDQYRIFGEISQTLYRGGMVNRNKEAADLDGQIEEQQLEVDLYQVRNRVNELFFGILLMQEQVAQSELVKADLNAGLKKVEAAMVNGTAIRSSADVIRAELLSVDQRIVEMESAAQSYRLILSQFMGETIGEDTRLEKPASVALSSDINRPELKLFEMQRRGIDSRVGLLSAAHKPAVELFLQGGYGRPGLNMLENKFNPYYLAGIRFSWKLSGFYTYGNEKQILSIRRQGLEVQEETFRFNTGLTLGQHEVEIQKLQRLIDVDEAIISLRRSVRETAAVQLEEGVITATDYVREVNAEDQAHQSRALHETQLLLAQAKYQLTSGNN